MRTLNVFVYGTLMSGFRANSFIPEGSKMLKGRIAGNLYHYAAGFPIVEILKHSQSVRGTRNYSHDIDVQDSLNRNEPECLPFDLNYGRVHGELYMIPCEDEETVLDTLDSYEGFTPESDYNLYNRTLVPVETEEGIIWAWIYNMETIPNATVQILSGNWRDCFYSKRGGLRPEVNRAIQKKTLLTDDNDEYDF